MQGYFDFATVFASEGNAPLKDDSAKKDWLLRDDGFLRERRKRLRQNDRGKGERQGKANREGRYAGA